ncbi:MAG: flagellar FlbD family protein [Oligoflexales bacterium]|nr:flagellar FlbD family protein [Oligoflexales bacterium]
MILLTKLDKASVLVNLETIKYVEMIPDTLILFLNGDSLIVQEPMETFVQKTVEYKAKILKSSHNPESTLTLS